MTTSSSPPVLAPWRDVRSLTASLNAGSPVPTWSVPSIRALLAERHRNGLSSIVRKVGARVLISEPGFYRWLDAQVEAAASPGAGNNTRTDGVGRLGGGK